MHQTGASLSPPDQCPQRCLNLLKHFRASSRRTRFLPLICQTYPISRANYFRNSAQNRLNDRPLFESNFN
jgi:hypothetical protein